MRAIAHVFIFSRRLYNSKKPPSRLHANVSALVCGKTSSFDIIHFEAYFGFARVACTRRVSKLFVLYVTVSIPIFVHFMIG